MKILITFLLFILSLSANNSWTGEWHVSWKSGAFFLTLEQNSTEVKGTYKPENGILNGSISGKELMANTRTENGLTNTLSLVMGESKNTFSGNTGDGEWVTGVRVSEDTYFNQYTMNLSSPLNVTYSFLSLGNAVRNGDYRALEKALEILNFTPEQKSLPHAIRLNLAQTFFHVLDQCQFFKRDFFKAKDKHARKVVIHQLGSDIDVSLSFTKKPEGWKIDVPSQDQLSTQLKALLAAHGKYEVNPQDNLKKETARDTMRTFIEQYQRWEEGGKAHVINTLNLSRVDPAIHEWQAPLLAFYLKSVLDKVSDIIYQELPNDPKSKKPYVHFYHQKGSIVIAPYQVGETTVWQFSPDTLAAIEVIYYEMEDVTPKRVTKSISENDLYFYLKDKAKSISPVLLQTIRHTEYWQILMLVCILALALFAAYIIRFFVMKGFNSFYLTKRWSEEMIYLRYIKPMQIIVFAVVLLYGAHALGLSNLFFSVIKSFSHLLIVLGATWFIYNLVSIIFDILQIYARKTATDVDEIILSLAGSVIRILVIVVAIFLVAEILKIPYKTVVAGLGIGGLAFAIAAKDSISNFFGSAIIIADRPFKTGDRVKVGENIGIISHVGIRSTKIRTLEDTLITVPNNLITNEIIDNYSERQVMRIETTFFLSLDTNKAQLNSLDEAITTFLNEDEDVNDKKVILTGVNDFTNRGIAFSVIFYVNATTETRYSELRHRLVSELAQIIKDKEIGLVLLPKGLEEL